jgi:hypothetical protein
LNNAGAIIELATAFPGNTGMARDKIINHLQLNSSEQSALGLD